jgi:FkbM family methyltransferase
MRQLKSFVKQIPGATSTVRTVRQLLGSRSPGCLENGDWIYERQVIEWLCNSSVRKQLPLPYRIFGAYCAFQHSLGTERIVGGQHLLKSVISLAKLLRLKEHARLKIGPHAVFLDLHDPRMLQIPNEVSPDYPDTAILKRFLGDGDTFVDAGANHGSFSIVASKLVGTQGLVVSIEPQKRKADVIEKSLAANGRCKYQVHRFACGDRTGTVEFFIPIGSSGGAGVFPEFSAVPPHRKVSVPMRRFDEALDWNAFPGRVFLKLDVEGSEMSFLRGAREMLRARKPPIMLEINPAAIKAAGESDQALLTYLEDLGYKHIFEVRPFSGPEPLSKLDAGARGDVRNVIVAPRELLLRMFSLLSLTEAEETLSLFSMVSFSLLS